MSESTIRYQRRVDGLLEDVREKEFHVLVNTGLLHFALTESKETNKSSEVARFTRALCESKQQLGRAEEVLASARKKNTGDPLQPGPSTKRRKRRITSLRRKNIQMNRILDQLAAGCLPGVCFCNKS